MDSFKKTEVEFWGFVDFSWIFRGFVGGFFVDFSWIHLKPCGFFMDSVGGFTLDLVWIWGGFPGFPLWRKWEIRFRIFGDTFPPQAESKAQTPCFNSTAVNGVSKKMQVPPCPSAQREDLDGNLCQLYTRHLMQSVHLQAQPFPQAGSARRTAAGFLEISLSTGDFQEIVQRFPRGTIFWIFFQKTGRGSPTEVGSPSVLSQECTLFLSLYELVSAGLAFQVFRKAISFFPCMSLFQQVSRIRL